MYCQLARLCSRSLINLFVGCIFTSGFLSLIACNHSTLEQYGFVTKLGNDTVAVESVTRQGNTLMSDAVDRFPLVRLRHTVVDLNADGSIKHLVMDIHTPSEPANQRERRVTADVSNGAVHISKVDGTGTLTRDFATNGGTAEAHVPQVYSLYELYFAAALKQAAAAKRAAGTAVPMRQFYIDREFDRFPLGHGRVTPIGNGKVQITHDWLSGTGEATMDAAYNMLGYSGARTTYKVEVKRLASPPDIKSIADRFETQERKTGPLKSMSVRDTTRAQIGTAVFLVDYSRPRLRGRTLLGDVIPFDRVWRTGANAATQFTTSVPVKLAGIQVPAGTYTLWTVPHPGTVDLIVNKQTGQWGTEYNSSLDLGKASMSSQQLSAPVEAFSISVVPVDAEHGTLVMEWGSFKWTASIEVQ